MILSMRSWLTLMYISCWMHSSNLLSGSIAKKIVAEKALDV